MFLSWHTSLPARKADSHGSSKTETGTVVHAMELLGCNIKADPLPPSPSLQPYWVTLMSQERLEEDDEPRLNVATLHAVVASTITENGIVVQKKRGK